MKFKTYKSESKIVFTLDKEFTFKQLKQHPQMGYQHHIHNADGMAYRNNFETHNEWWDEQWILKGSIIARVGRPC